jgi:hypothetical protein
MALGAGIAAMVPAASAAMSPATVASVAVAAPVVAFTALESLGTGSPLRGAVARVPLGIAAVPASAPAAPAVALSAAKLLLAAGFAANGRRFRLRAGEEAL